MKVVTMPVTGVLGSPALMVSTVLGTGAAPFAWMIVSITCCAV